MKDKVFWDIIDSYFKTIKNNLVNHQIDSYNMFIIERIPKVVRQFNPITSYYNDNQVKIDIIIGGSLDNDNNIINDGKGIYISKPVLNNLKQYENENKEQVFKNELKQLYPNEARLKNLTYSINIYFDVYVVYNNIKYKYINLNKTDDINDEYQWVEIDNPKYKDYKSEKLNMGNIPVMLKSKLCVLNDLPPNVCFDMGECKYDQGGYFIIDGKEKVLISQEEQTLNKLFIRKGREGDYYEYQSSIRSSPEDKFQDARSTKINILKEKIKSSKMDKLQKKQYNSQFKNINPALCFFEKVTNHIKEGTIRVMMPKIKEGNEFETNIPLFIIFRALGVLSDKDILEYIIYDVNDPNNKIYLDVLQNSVKDGQGVYTQVEAFLYLQNKISDIKDKGEDYKFIYILDLLQNHFIPHVGSSLQEKAFYLGYMVRETLNRYLGFNSITDKDNYIYKRVNISGFLIGTIFRDLYFRFKNHVEYTINTQYSNLQSFLQGDEVSININNIINNNNIREIFNPKWMNDGFRYAFKNAWGLKGARGNKLGLVQDLNRLSFLGTMSHLRRINNPIPKGTKIRQPHSLHGSSWGIICPVETPDGGRVGIVKNLALLGQVTFGCSSNPLFNCLKHFGMVHFNEISFKNMNQYTLIFLNERIVGLHKHPDLFVKILKNLRRNMLINVYTSISWYVSDKQIKISTDSGRSCRPLIIVETFKKIFKDKNDLSSNIIKTIFNNNWYKLLGLHDIKLSSEKNIDSNYLNTINYDSNYYYPDILINSIPQTFKNDGVSFYKKIIEKLENSAGLLEYIDTEESNNCFISLYPNQLYEEDNNKYTHCEIHPMLMLGVLGSIIPFVDSNQYPRNLFSTGQSKQAISIYSTNYKNRMDTEGQIIFYGEKPIVKTRFEKYLNTDKLPYGMNAVIAIACYSGYNQEDSIIINKSSVDRGLFRTMIFKTYVEQEENIEYSDLEEKFRFNSEDNVINRKAGNYSKLDKNGIVREFDNEGKPMHVDENDIIISKVIKHSDKDGKEYYTDNSTFIKRTQQGYIDKVYLDTKNDGYKFCKIRIRKLKVPEMGDKFCSRHGQKGVIGMILPREDMPFTKDGIVPDMIINPHAIPSRMTIGQFVECVMGKAGSMLGVRSDSTGFTNIDKDKMCNILEHCGFEKYSNEVLYNGNNGKQLNTSIFIGPTFYLRLTHQVSKKIYSRATGAVTMLTKQPLGGRSAGGGLRIGEMERDAILAHGSNLFLKESMLERADKYSIWVSDKSGLFSIVNQKKNIYKDFSSDAYKHEIENNIPKKTQTEISHVNYHKILVPYAFKLLIQELEVMNIGPRILTEDSISKWIQVNKRDENNLYNISDETMNDEQYYKKSGSKITEKVRRLHNFIKQNLINGSIPTDKVKSIMDLSCGIGGDIHKWRNYDFIYAIDIDSKNIGNKRDIDKRNLWSRINKIKEFNKNYKHKKFITITSDMSDQKLLNHKDLKGVKVDTITIFFSIHYIFNNKKRIDSLFNNVKQFLKPNGYCFITTFDGEKVFKKLKKSNKVNKDKTKYIEIKDKDDNIIFKIEMTKELLQKSEKYDKLPSNEESLNFPINVTFETFDKQKEYLVNSNYLTNIAKSYGLEIITLEELYKDFDKSLFMKGSDTFENFSNNMKSLGLTFSKDNLRIDDINIELKESMSDINRYYIFKNRNDCYFEPYKNKEKCKDDYVNQENLSGSYLNQIFLTSNSQKFCKNNIDLQRLYNGPSLIKNEKYNSTLDNVFNNLNENYDLIDQLSFENTFDYLYNKIGEGIFVKIKNKILVSYIIFVKSNYLDLIDSKYDVNLQNYFTKNKIDFKKINYKKNCNRLIENNDDLFYYLNSNKNYGILKFLILKICNYCRENKKELNDCEFFVNIHNCPILKSINTLNLENDYNIENQDNLYEGKHIKFSDDKNKIKGLIYKIHNDDYVTIRYINNKDILYKTIHKNKILKSEVNKLKYMPILSFFKDNKEYYFNDICIPNLEDWIISTNKIFPTDCLKDVETEEEDIDNKIYTVETAPDKKFKSKFKYYFSSLPKKVYLKLQMDKTASFSVTNLSFADDISRIMLKYGCKKTMEVTDATACVGGNTMSFCKYFEKVNSIEFDSTRFDMLKNNLNLIYNNPTTKKDLLTKKTNLKLYNNDYLNILPEIENKDVIFFDPPWGGEDYKKNKEIMPMLNNMNMELIVDMMFKKYKFKFVILKLPVNFVKDFKIVSGDIIFSTDLKNDRGVKKMKIIVAKISNLTGDEYFDRWKKRIEDRQENKTVTYTDEWWKERFIKARFDDDENIRISKLDSSTFTGNQKGGKKINWTNRKNKILYREFFCGSSFDTKSNLQLKLIIDNLNNDDLDCKFFNEYENKINLFDKKTNTILNLPSSFLKDNSITVNVDKSELFTKDNNLEIFNNYKYVIYISNYTNNIYYSKLMSLGCVIIKIKNDNSYKDWISDKLTSLDFREEITKNIENIEADHIEITYNELNDLYNWLEMNQDICKKIIENNNKKYNEIIDEKQIIDYWIESINLISSFTSAENNLTTKKINLTDNIKPFMKPIHFKNIYINNLMGDNNKNKFIIERNFNVKLLLTTDIISKKNINYRIINIEGSFEQDVENCYNYINSYNNLIIEKFVLPVEKNGYNILNNFIKNIFNLEKRFNIKINIMNKKDVDTEWYLHNQTFMGKQLVKIVSFNKENLDKFLNLVKEKIINKKPDFMLLQNSLLNIPLLTYNFDYDNKNINLDYDRKFKIGFVTALPNNVLKTNIESFKSYIRKLFTNIEKYNENVSCKLIIVKQKKQTKNSDFVNNLPNFLFDSNSLKFNNFACLNAGYCMEINQNYDRFIFHDFNIQIKNDYLNDEDLLKIISKNNLNNNPILLTHSNKMKHNNHIIILNKDTFYKTKGFPNYYWDLLDGYYEFITKCSGGLLNWWEHNKNDNLFQIIKPVEITYNYFELNDYIEIDHVFEYEEI